MARTSNGSPDYIIGPDEAASTDWTCHFFYQDPEVPGSTSGFAFGISTSAGAESFACLWDHPNAAYRQSWFCFDGGAFPVAKYSTSLQANTIYAMGGRLASGTLSAWLNGTNETSVGSVSSGGITANHNLSLFSYLEGTSGFVNGTMAEFGLWSVALSDAEMVSLAKGYSPLLIRPASLLRYIPLLRGIYDAKGGALTSSGTTVATHPRVIMPRRRQTHHVTAAGGGVAGLVRSRLLSRGRLAG